MRSHFKSRPRPSNALAEAGKTADQKAQEADEEILAAIASRRKLASDMELAKGITYTEALTTS